MNKEDTQLLLKDLCVRLPYGVKILHEGWDCDCNTDFETVETLIGIDDKFIYTIWDKTGDREKHCLSVSNWKPYLRSMSSMTEKEKKEYELLANYCITSSVGFVHFEAQELIEWLTKNMFDYLGLIPKGLALETPNDMYITSKENKENEIEPSFDSFCSDNPYVEMIDYE